MMIETKRRYPPRDWLSHVTKKKNEILNGYSVIVSRPGPSISLERSMSLYAICMSRTPVCFYVSFVHDRTCGRASVCLFPRASWFFFFLGARSFTLPFIGFPIQVFFFVHRVGHLLSYSCRLSNTETKRIHTFHIYCILYTYTRPGKRRVGDRDRTERERQQKKSRLLVPPAKFVRDWSMSDWIILFSSVIFLVHCFANTYSPNVAGVYFYFYYFFN